MSDGKKFLVLLVSFIAAMAAINIALVQTHHVQWNGSWNWQRPWELVMDWRTFATMFGAAVTIAVLSQLYQDNPLLKLIEHMFVGSAVAYGLMNTWFMVWTVEITPISTMIRFHWMANAPVAGSCSTSTIIG